jgi:hypothetical protein
MPVSTRAIYTGNGVQTAFDYNFPLADETNTAWVGQLRVYKRGQLLATGVAYDVAYDAGTAE